MAPTSRMKSTWIASAEAITFPGRDDRSASAPTSASENGDMLLQIPDVLTPDQVTLARQRLERAEWVDGRVTAGHQSVMAKDNMQLPEAHPAAIELGEMILAALQRHPLFISAALPARVFPPLFNRYQGGQSFG